MRRLSANEQIALNNYERREVLSAGSAYAQRVAAQEYPFLPEKPSRAWCKLIWYSEKCGGKLIIFKSGNPYLPKEGKRKDGEAIEENEREAVRLSQSLSRTKRRIFEIAACNKWEWFFTGTLDETKADRYDLDGTFKRLSQYIRDYRKATGREVRYLIVPEQHKNGAWHFHGLLAGIPAEALYKFTLDEHLPARIRGTISGGTDVYEWKEYSRRFGYTTLTAVRDENAVACYVTKYITKEMQTIANNNGYKHLYYCSRGLKKPDVVAESHSAAGYLPICDFANDYVAVRKVQTRQEAEAIISRYGLRREGGKDNEGDV